MATTLDAEQRPLPQRDERTDEDDDEHDHDQQRLPRSIESRHFLIGPNCSGSSLGLY
jgi:hypothetical protein